MIKIGNTEIASIPGIDKVYLGDELVFGGNIIPPEYQRVQYINGGGASVLDTGIVIAETDTIKIVYQMETSSVGGDKMIIAQKAGNTGDAIFIETYSANNAWYVKFGSSSSAGAASTNVEKTGTHTLELRKNYFGVDGSSRLTPGFNSMPNTSLCICGKIKTDLTIQYGCYGNIYDVKIVDSNNDLRWWGIPVKEVNGTGVGLYDTVSGQLFESVTATPFTAGPDYV